MSHPIHMEARTVAICRVTKPVPCLRIQGCHIISLAPILASGRWLTLGQGRQKGKGKKENKREKEKKKEKKTVSCVSRFRTCQLHSTPSAPCPGDTVLSSGPVSVESASLAVHVISRLHTAGVTACRDAESQPAYSLFVLYARLYTAIICQSGSSLRRSPLFGLLPCKPLMGCHPHLFGPGLQ